MRRWKIVKRWIPKEGDQWFSHEGLGWCGIPFHNKTHMEFLKIIRPKIRRLVKVA